MDLKKVTPYFAQKYVINSRSYLQVKPDPDKAVNFYKTHLLSSNQELDPLLRDYNFKSELPSWKWELFIAILVGDIATSKRRRGTKGADLLRHEVKTAQNGRDFEYQYHKRSWKEKLEKEALIDHIYVSYWEGFRDFDVRLVQGKELTDFFDSWEPDLITTYECEKPKQRFRRRIPYKSVVERGNILLKMRNGEAVSDKTVC